MKFGIIPINVGAQASPERIAALAEKAEAVGVESVWTFEHVIVPAEYESKYPYHPSGKLAATPETPFIDPLIALTYAAARTTRLRLGTGINILSQANPLMLAKQAASLDVLSGGRLLLGLGVGWLKEEFDALGAPFARRGARADDYIEAMKKVWAGELVEHESEFVSWHGFKSYPLPAQKPHPPLIVGGDSPPALRRVARYGDGWFATFLKPDALAEHIRTIHAHAREFGRDPAEIEISAFWTRSREGLDSVRELEDLGVARLIAPLQSLGEDDPLVGVERLAENVIAKL
ncbi:MAG: TIGR03619 family F420-dependent LLM class oxidoreductase [SAR324 cluster bacterium]|nr:TIGR03619 family F420-dependent LLM class oxidoreductase [SAR324 cluster bacterium]